MKIEHNPLHLRPSLITEAFINRLPQRTPRTHSVAWISLWPPEPETRVRIAVGSLTTILILVTIRERDDAQFS